jgi:regulator of sirC expression with transglutaminase-like and TPR domain
MGQGNVFDQHFFPVEAVSWLETHPQDGHMFNEFDWGGYLLLRLWPDQQIFMDGHTHIYGEALTREYEQVITLNTGWEEILRKHDVNWVILRVNTSLAKVLSASADWTAAYQDQTAIIFVHK